VKRTGGKLVSKSRTGMPVDHAPSSRVFTDCDSLPTLEQAVAGGPSQRSPPSSDTGAQREGSQRPDPPPATSQDTGSEERHAVFSVELLRHDGGLPETSLRRVLEHIQTHLDQELTITALAAVAELSPYHFSRLFKQSTGLSPHQHLLRQRIERARGLLAGPRRRIAQVSYELGFPNQSHFTTVFRKLVGVTPRTYQRQCSGN
jgi:AraC family transcriptional regulator